MLPSPLQLQAASLLPQCLMPGHTATEYAIRVGDTPLRPHPHPGQPLDPKGRSCHGLPSAPPVYLSSHQEWRLINTVHGDQAQAQLPLLSCTLGAAGEQPLPRRGLWTHTANASQGEICRGHFYLGFIFLWVWRDSSAWKWAPEPRTDPGADGPCPAGASAWNQLASGFQMSPSASRSGF